MAVSSGRILLSDIEKDAIRSAAIEHNREIPLIIHQLAHGDNVHATVRQIYSSLDSTRARRRIYDFLQREIKKATTAKLIQHTRHVDPNLYMPSSSILSCSSQMRGNGRGRRGYPRSGYTRHGSIIGLTFDSNDDENEGQAEQYQEQFPGDTDEREWNDEDVDEDEHNKEHGLTFDNCINQSEDDEMLVDQDNDVLEEQQQDIPTTSIASEFQVVIGEIIDRVVENDRSDLLSQSTLNAPGPTNASISSTNLHQTNTTNARSRAFSLEYDTPPTLNRVLNLNAASSNRRSSTIQFPTNSRHSNARGRIARGGSQPNARRRRRRLNSTASNTDDAIHRTTHDSNNEDEPTSGQEPRRSLTRVLIETADSLKEAAMMATRACALAMQKINEL